MKKLMLHLLVLLTLSVSSLVQADTASDLVGLGMPAPAARYLASQGFVVPRGNPITHGNFSFGPDSGRKVAKGVADISLGVPTSTFTTITQGGENTAGGVESLRELVYGSDNSCYGSRSCRDQTNAYYNSGFGHYALGFNILGIKNTAVGAFSQQGAEGVSNQQENSSVGFRSMEKITLGQYNDSLGARTLLNLTTGDRNFAGGADTLQALTTADGNTCVGQASCLSLNSDDNTVVGLFSGDGITTGSGNTLLGARIVSLASGLTNNIILASGATTRAQFDGSNWLFQGDLETIGTYRPAAKTDAAAATNSLYFSSTGSKLSYKDSSGTVHALH